MASTSAIDLAREARRLKALSEETRLRALNLLRAGELCQHELVAALNVRQPLVAFHMKILKEAGLVAERRRGRRVHYALKTAAVRDVEDFLRVIRTPRTERRRCEVTA